MALSKCPACGHTVSQQAAACPSCGHPLNQTGAPNSGDWVKLAGIAGGAWLLPKLAKIVFAIIVFVAFFYFIFGSK